MRKAGPLPVREQSRLPYRTPVPTHHPEPVLDVVVPVFNEETDLEPSVRRLHAHLSETFPYAFRITVADNASTDRTPQTAARLAEEFPEVTWLRLADKGRGRALSHAWSLSTAPVLAYMDVDLSTDLTALLPLVAPLISGHSDIAIGTRLAPGSRVSVHFTPVRRDVELGRGQAFFEVTPHSMRPFTVHVNGLSVLAVGTAFDVRSGPSSTVVTVGAGTVNVIPGSDGSAGKTGTGIESARARAGQRLTFSPSTRRLMLAKVSPTAAGSWRGGVLQFMGEPLEEVVETLNRYRSPRIVVGPELQQTRFTGTVAPAEVRDWLAALEKIYACKVVDRGVDGIFIQARAYPVARN